MGFLWTFYSQEKDSPVFHKPEILTFGRAVAHNQDSMIYELWVAVRNVVQTWRREISDDIKAGFYLGGGMNSSHGLQNRSESCVNK